MQAFTDESSDLEVEESLGDEIKRRQAAAVTEQGSGELEKSEEGKREKKINQ